MSVVHVARKVDVSSIVDVHISAFPGFFLTILGPNFLKRFYSVFIEHQDAELLTVEHDGKLCGFAAYTWNPDEFFSYMKRHYGLSLAFAMFPGLLRNPVLTLQKLYRAMFYRGDKAPSMGNLALLSSIGVARSSKGQGLGSILIERMCEDLSERHCKGVYLTTDVDENQATLRFYEKQGFSIHSQFTQSGGRQMYRLVKEWDK